jgi:hypothetical protein
MVGIRVRGPGSAARPLKEPPKNFKTSGDFDLDFQIESFLGIILKRKDAFGLECTIESRERNRPVCKQ